MRILLFALCGLASVACLDEREGRPTMQVDDDGTVIPRPATQGFFDIGVNSESTVELIDVCFTIAVEGGDGESVWEQSACSNSRYGNGSGGDITYIGVCDSTSPNTNTVRLWIDAITTADPGVQLQNPCPGEGHQPDKACTLTASCIEDMDVLVEFNLTLVE